MSISKKSKVKSNIYICSLIVYLLALQTKTSVKIDAKENPDMKKVEAFIKRRSTIPPKDIETQWEAYLQSKLHNFTATEKRCLTLRRYLSTLPATEINSTVISFFQTLFKKRSSVNYRKAAYDIIMNSEDDDDIPEIRYMKGIVPQLYRLKMDYHTKYPKSRLFRNNDHEIEAIEEDLNFAKEKMVEARKRMNEINEKKNDCVLALKDVVAKLKDPTSEIYQKMRTVEYWEKLQTHIYNVSYIADINEGTTSEVYIEIIPEYQENVKTFFDLLEKFDTFDKMDIFLNYTYNSLGKMNGVAFKKAAARIPPMSKGLEEIQKDMEEDLEKEREIIYKAIQEKITGVFYEIRGDPTLIQYQELLGEAEDFEEEMNKLISEVLENQDTVTQLELKLGTLSEEVRKTFILSKKVICDMEMDIIELEENFEWLKGLKKETCPADASENEKNMTSSQNFVVQFKSVATMFKNLQKKELNYLNEIYKLEVEVDKTVGKIFASIFILKNGLQCFTASELSYYFFNMFKTNFIIDETTFMQSFLKSLSPANARSFIILNYAIFTNDKYVESVIKKNKPKMVDGLVNTGLDKLINDFAMHNSLMVNLYKDYVYAENQNHQENVMEGSITSVIFHILFFLREVYKSNVEQDLSIEMLFNIIYGVLWGMVPFIDQFMFIQTLANKFISLFLNILYSLIDKFLKVGKTKMQAVMTKLGQNVMSSDYSSYSYDLDFEKVIEEQKEKTPDPAITISFRQIEEVYFNYFNDNSILISAEKINVFNPEEFLLKEDDEIELDQVDENETEDPSDAYQEDVFVFLYKSI